MDDDPSSLVVRVSSEVGRLALGRARAARIARRVLQGERCRSIELTIAFVSARRVTQLNRHYLGHAGTTDIITFEHSPVASRGPRVGDVYIAPLVAARHARGAGISQREELVRLVVHGVLHALGWSHPDGGERERSPMWQRQERWVSRLRAEGAW